ncbi:Dipeptide transport system permease protein DppC [Hydrogenovibrio crunogenus]|uniref:Dipeptide transport system permease protein DppC n=1 Tax=Hydrogenovibrio crunogenus TaxID=39765 RepID=A0A4P7NZE7_9GAMM|nr:ABC transporter permease [Hydrogenovibrio crunogenus]QBZ83211.1 Dipeptide transport system permease protein DppC [Hydrogenovibrio crunogenus]
MSSFSLIPLWTDYMIWGLVIALIIWGRLISRSIQVKQQWLQIFESKLAMVSAIVLLFYLAIALLDSIHFKIESKDPTVISETQSALDAIFPHLAYQQERTYSAPFATTEYNKSLNINELGEIQQIYRPLKHIDVSGSVSITQATLEAFLAGIAISLLFIWLHALWRSRVHQLSVFAFIIKVIRNQTLLPWRTAYITFTVIMLFLSWLYFLSFFYHVFGTDKVGGDVLYESLKSIRTGVLIGVLTTLVMLPLSITLGISAGLFRGWVDDVIQYIYTTLNSIPGVLLIAAAVLVMQVIMGNHPDWFTSTEERADVRLLFLIFILGMTSWTGLCRLLRAETLKISQVEYVTASKAFGVSRFKIIGRHIMPNVMHIVLISVVLDFSGLVLAEAVLSYVGVGVDPTMHSWGNMINQARLEMAREPMVWWSLFSAFFFMFILVLAANLFSDRVQTVLDPRNNR